MGDLEHISHSIPKVYETAAQAAQREHLAAQIRAIPASPPPGDAEIQEWASPVPAMPWPPGLESRVTEAREAVQALDLDAALRILFAIELDLYMIQRQNEHVALRQAGAPHA